MELFDYEPLVLEVSMTLLAKLNSKQPFLEGKTKYGQIYIAGGDGGARGKQVTVEGDKITIYDGYCSISFG